MRTARKMRREYRRFFSRGCLNFQGMRQAKSSASGEERAKVSMREEELSLGRDFAHFEWTENRAEASSWF